MKEVHAVSNENQAALDVRGYYLMRLRRFETPITPETPHVPNQLAKPTTGPARGKRLKPSPRSKATRQKKPRRVRRGARTAGTTPAWRKRTTADTLARFRNGSDRTPGPVWHVATFRVGAPSRNSTTRSAATRRRDGWQGRHLGTGPTAERRSMVAAMVRLPWRCRSGPSTWPGRHRFAAPERAVPAGVLIIKIN